MRRLAALAALLVLAGPGAAYATEGLQVRIDDLQVTMRDQATRIETTEAGTSRSVAVPSDVLFAFDSARLSAAGERALHDVARDLRGAVDVTGHTDARGSRAYNRRLSLRRAEAAARALRAAAPAAHVRVHAAGESRPVASNRGAAGRACNRRVEITAPNG